MRRRTFIREVVLLSSAPLLWLPRKSSAQVAGPNDPAFMANTQAAAAGGASCDTLRDSNTAGTASVSNGNSINFHYFGHKITAGASYTCCKIRMFLRSSGSPTFDIYAGIWSHDSGGDQPSALIGTEGGPINATTVGASDTTVDFSGASAAMTNGTAYWIVLRMGDGLTSPSPENYISVARITAGGRIMYDNDGTGTWTLESAARYWKFALYSA